MKATKIESIFGAVVPAFLCVCMMDACFVYAQEVPAPTVNESSSLTSPWADKQWPDAPMSAAEELTRTALPSTLTPALLSSEDVFISHPRPIFSTKGLKKWEKVTHRTLLIALPAALTADMVTSYLNETHLLHFTFHQVWCTTTINGGPPVNGPCPPAVQQNVFREDFSGQGYFEEKGWAQVFGKRNAPATILANVGFDLLAIPLDRKLWRKSAFWRYADLAALAWKTAGHAIPAVRNMQYIHATEKQLIPQSAGDVRWY